ncbi:MAG: F0F1 ATP synthase subunit A [Eggerthellaceae bacterium]|nr:F0F1 ATP synthase subunit A [Eggerthellaceae bacterium]
MDALEQLGEYAQELTDSFQSAVVWGNNTVGITQYIFWMIICWIITCVVVLVVARRLTLIPHNKFINTVEYGYQFVRNEITEGVVGHGFKKFVPFLATLFFFILVSNFVGLIPGCKTPTGSLSVTWALSTMAFFYFNIAGIRAKGGWTYVKSIAPSGLPLVMVPIIWFFETFSLVLRWLTLAVRLYGNMFAGHMVLGIFAIATSVFISANIAPFSAVAFTSIGWFLLLLIMYALETLVAFLQAYVFTVLTSVYISIATSTH